MKELGSFLIWSIALLTSVLLINLIAKLVGAPGDIAMLLSFFPIIAAFGFTMDESGGHPMAVVLRYSAWFYGGFAACLITAFLLSQIV